MSRISYSDRLLRTFFVAALIILVFVSSVFFWNRTRLSNDQFWLEHTYQVLVNLEDTFSTLKDAETGQRGYLITGDTSYLQPYHNAIASIPSKLDTLGLLLADNPSQQQRLSDLQ